MKAVTVVEGIYRVAAQIKEKGLLFEGTWPISNGIMLDSYIVKGSNKIALIDLVKDWDGAVDSLARQITSLGLKVADIDYIVINHMEPDHTGDLINFVAKNPTVQIYCSPKSVPLIKAFYNIEENIHAIADGETLDLGGKTLSFHLTPNVHWPETMMTFAEEDHVLFSCDAFGSYGNYDSPFDDQLTEEEKKTLPSDMERYYSNIISSFSPFVLRALDKVAPLGIKFICPSHGIMWRDDVDCVLSWYQKLASYDKGPQEKEITLVFSSMYGNTEALVDSFKKGVESVDGVKLHIIRVPQTHVSFVLEKAWRSSGLIIGMPTYKYKMFPPMYNVLDEIERSHIVKRKIIRFGSYGWSGGAEKQFTPFVDSLKLDYMGAVEFQGAPCEAEEKKAFDLAVKMATAIKEEK